MDIIYKLLNEYLTAFADKKLLITTFGVMAIKQKSFSTAITAINHKPLPTINNKKPQK